MMPGMARKRHLMVEKREDALAEAVNKLARERDGTARFSEIGIITSGVCYQYVRDALPDASTLKLGMVYPLPMRTIEEFAKQVKRLIVIEELEGLDRKRHQGRRDRLRGQGAYRHSGRAERGSHPLRRVSRAAGMRCAVGTPPPAAHAMPRLPAPRNISRDQQH